jgi:DNA-binding NtrC family response regulator
MRPLQVVVVDDEPNTGAFLQGVFAAEGHVCEVFHRADAAEEYLSSHAPDLALLDVYLGAESGLELARRIRLIHPGLYLVIISAHVSLETAAESVAQGAIEYISKPISVEQLHAVSARADRYRTKFHQQIPAYEPSPQKSAIIGRSPKMLEVYNAIARVAPSNANVLILGASGTGKELVARAIHQYSKRAPHPFTPVNCGSFTETILESELFGHEKGAFTGAQTVHRGLVESSTKGTLFLDEVTETTLAFQVKLLRVIQEQQVRRVGSNKYLPVDVRILAASNRDMAGLIKQDAFREDLYYRLSVVQIVIPPLTERREDIPLLVAHFLDEFNAKNERTVAIEQAAVMRLQQMQWPGNVRELENMVNRLAIFAPIGRITLADIESELERGGASVAGSAPVSVTVPDRLLEMERQHILRVLKESRGNKTEAARRLGIERKTLYKKAVRLGINLQPVDER